MAASSVCRVRVLAFFSDVIRAEDSMIFFFKLHARWAGKSGALEFQTLEFRNS